MIVQKATWSNIHILNDIKLNVIVKQTHTNVIIRELSNLLPEHSQCSCYYDVQVCGVGILQLSSARAMTTYIHLMPDQSIIPVNTKHLYNIYTMLAQRWRRWANVVWMLRNVVFTELANGNPFTAKRINTRFNPFHQPFKSQLLGTKCAFKLEYLQMFRVERNKYEEFSPIFEAELIKILSSAV